MFNTKKILCVFPRSLIEKEELREVARDLIALKSGPRMSISLTSIKLKNRRTSPCNQILAFGDMSWIYDTKI